MLVLLIIKNTIILSNNNCVTAFSFSWNIAYLGKIKLLTSTSIGSTVLSQMQVAYEPNQLIVTN